VPHLGQGSGPGPRQGRQGQGQKCLEAAAAKNPGEDRFVGGKIQGELEENDGKWMISGEKNQG